MTKSIRFTKMHGVGNDHIYVNMMVYPIDDPEELSIAWSKSRTGIGSDGLVLTGSSDIVDSSMYIYNVDGSEAMICKNVSRRIGKYVYEVGLTQKNRITLETSSGTKELQLKIEREEVTGAVIDMGMPTVDEIALEVEAGREIYTGIVVSMEDPHLITFVDEMDKVDLANVDPLLEHLPFSPDRTSAESVQVLKLDETWMRVQERGSGIIQACETGTCATTVAGVIRGKTKRKTKVTVNGSPLTIEWGGQSDKVFITGGAVSTFEGFIRA